MYYINYKTKQGVETVDEAESLKDAKYLLNEYNMAFNGGCYISQRSTNEWKNR